jgi:hypothetical protein
MIEIGSKITSVPVAERQVCLSLSLHRQFPGKLTGNKSAGAIQQSLVLITNRIDIMMAFV